MSLRFIKAPLRYAIVITSLVAAANTVHARPITLSEDFIDVSTLTSTGWVQKNNSADPDQPWAQGNDSIFFSQAEFPNEYISVGFDSTTGNSELGETISNWLLTPQVSLHNGDMLSFYSRTVDVPAFPDRLEVRLSTNGASTDVGINPEDTGDFNTLLLSINPDLTTTDYPNSWTKYDVTVSGLADDLTTGRFAFRYYVTDAGLFGTNGDYLGVDTLSITSVVPEPGTIGLLGLGLLIGGGAFIRRRINKSHTL